MDLNEEFENVKSQANKLDCNWIGVLVCGPNSLISQTK